MGGGWVEGWIERRMDNGWVSGVGSVDGWMMDCSVDGWMHDGWVDLWIDGWVDRWMDKQMDR